LQVILIFNLKDFIFDFGSLNPKVEKVYAGSMMRNVFGIKDSIYGRSKDVFELFLDLISESQDFIREITKEVSSCSLRDIERCLKLFLWFDKYTSSDSKCLIKGEFQTKTFEQLVNINNFIIICLGHVYYSRLPRKERNLYHFVIENKWKKLAKQVFFHIFNKK
jgi:hypothetical protein